MSKKYIEELWNSYNNGVLRSDAGPVQREETRRAFYGGAGALFKALMDAMSPGTQEKEEDITVMEDVSAELHDFADSLDGGTTKGRVDVLN